MITEYDYVMSSLFFGGILLTTNSLENFIYFVEIPSKLNKNNLYEECS